MFANPLYPTIASMDYLTFNTRIKFYKPFYNWSVMLSLLFHMHTQYFFKQVLFQFIHEITVKAPIPGFEPGLRVCFT